MRLKESDPLFELILKWIMSAEWDMTLTIREAMVKAESMIKLHIENPTGSELSRKCPGIGSFFTELPLTRALDYINQKVALEQRRFVPPSFSEIRQIFNLAQVYSLKDRVKMLTFDADDTLYDHGMDLEGGSWMVDALATLMETGTYVAVVTAAGYPGKPDRYAARFKGLLDYFKAKKSPKEVTDRFFCVGGECNFLFRVVPDTYDMYEVPTEEWQTSAMKEWKEADVTDMLDVAEEALRESCTRMRLDVQFLRKSRAIGCFPTRAEDRIAYEALEDVALAIQDKLTQKNTLSKLKVPFCAFNGNRDVWVDVGDKRYGIQALLEYLGVSGEATCHLGDRFTNTGNDKSSRGVAMTIWVTNPTETEEYLHLFLTETGNATSLQSAERRPRGPKQGTMEWEKAQVVQRNTAA
mmetsp:Transcript_15223/g.22266  ORF Transcript_15223/g.22266 Transcript_15223/m.22266 type:complete len:410 (+) Transcript_15223:112-1341(+)